MALRRGTTPLLAAPVPSLEASNQSQIEDLVQRNRTLEHTIQTLSSQLTLETTRSKSAVEAVQVEHGNQQQRWKEALEDVLGTYRVVQRQLECDVEKERCARVSEMEELRKERRERCKRDYKLRLWIMEGEEMRRRVDDAELELQDVRAEWEEREGELEVTVKELKERAVKAEKELKSKESQLTTLREKHANVAASNSTFDSKLERLQLSNDLLSTQKADLGQELVDEKRKTAELTRQLEHWQTLDNKQGKRTEQLEKRVQELEGELQDKGGTDDTKIANLEKELKKEKGRVEKMKIVNAQWQDELTSTQSQLEEANSTIESQSSEIEQLKKSFERLEKRNQKLKDDLEAERARVAPSTSRTEKPDVPTIEVEDASQTSSEGLEVLDAPPARGSKKPKSTVKAPGSKTQPNEAGTSHRTKQVARKSTGGRPPKGTLQAVKRKAEEEEESDSDVEEIEIEEEEPEEPAKKTKSKPASKAATNPRKKKPSPDEEEEVEEVEKPPTKKPKPKPVSRKRKASEEDDDVVEVVEEPKTKPKSKSASKPASAATTTTKTTSRARSKAPSRAGSRAPSAKPQSKAKGKQKEGSIPEEDEDSDSNANDESAKDAAPKKKKRKINIFPSNDKGAGMVLSQFSGPGLAGSGSTSTLDIPTFLSPVRQDELVPPRSMAGSGSSIVGSLAGLMKRPFGGR